MNQTQRNQMHRAIKHHNQAHATEERVPAGSGVTRRTILSAAGALVAGAFIPLVGCSLLPAPPVLAADASSASDEDESSHQEDSASDDADGAGPSGLTSRMFFAFDTIVTVKGAGMSDELFERIGQDCARYDELFSAHSATSDIARINAAGGAPVQVDPDTADLIARSLEVCEEFDGDFDITIGAVSLLWDFVEGKRPSDQEIAQAVQHVDWHGVHVSGTTVTLDDPEAKLDLGGVAKGWIAERLRQTLSEAGVTSADVDLGTSSIYLLGTKPDGSDWRIGLRDPANPDGPGLGVIECHDRAAVTSGLYDQHFVQDGVDYHHILDPRTGYPAQTDMAALTAVLPDSILGDGMTTALFVRGTSGALDWVAAHPEYDVEAAFIASDDSITFTDCFRQRYSFQPADGERTASSAQQDASSGQDR